MSQPKSSEQARRFADAARDLGADESGEAFERAFGVIAPPKRAPDGSANAKRAKGGKHGRQGVG
jgi:hypothetical protein